MNRLLLNTITSTKSINYGVCTEKFIAGAFPATIIGSTYEALTNKNPTFHECYLTGFIAGISWITFPISLPYYCITKKNIIE